MYLRTEVMGMKRALWGVFLFLSIALGALGSGNVSPLGIVPEAPTGLSVAIWPEKPQYHIGDYARIYFYVSQPAYVYIYDFQPDGVVRQIFPNWWSRNPFVSAGTHVLPDNPNWRLRVTPPTGTDKLLIIASTRPLNCPLGSQGEPFPLMGRNREEGRAHILGLIPEEGGPCCATAWCTVEILPGYVYQPWQPCPPCWYGPCPPCQGYQPPPCISCGWGWYLDSSGQWHMFVGQCPPQAVWCWYYGPDGQWHLKIKICLGGNCP